MGSLAKGFIAESLQKSCGKFAEICKNTFSLTLQTLLFWKKQGSFPKKARVFLFAEPLKSLEKEGKTQEKASKIGKRKKQGNRKKQGLEGQGYCVRKGCGNSAESCGNFQKMFCNDPFPNNPISESPNTKGVMQQHAS